MLIRFKCNNGYTHADNIENIKKLRVTYNDITDGYMVIWHFSSHEQAIEALDKIHTAYADGLKAITLEVD